MKLTRNDRIILVNQMRILEAVGPNDERDDFKKAADALRHGWELEYEELFQSVWPEGLTTEECQEVLETLSMFVRLRDSYARLDDKSGIDDEYGLKFRGYDGNLEGQFVEYVEFVRRKGSFPQMLPRGENFRSNYGDRETYQRMLAKFTEITKGKRAEFLKKADIEAVLYERIHPERRAEIAAAKKKN